MLLSKRLEKAKDLVTPGTVLVDIGTDHGYLPIALLQEGAIPSALAFDVRTGPLKAAEQNIRSAGLSEKTTLRLSDGFSALLKGEAETASILGMGGSLIRRILEEGNPKELGIRELILGPQSEQKMLRSYLTRNGFRILTECYVFEDGKYYVLMKTSFEEEPPYTPAELLFGRPPLVERDPVLLSYLSHREAVLTKILASLPENPKGEERKREVEEELALIGEVKW